jgi:hypothetical protein
MALADGTFFYPTRKDYDSPDNYDLVYEDVWIPSSEGARLHGWFFPAANPANPAGTIVHCHGNAGNITAHFKFAAWLPARGWNLLCFDYRGYGRSTGRPTRAGVIDDVHAAIDYARMRSDVDADRLAVFGQSLGGSVAIVALAQRDHAVAGLCVEGPFASYREEARFVTRRVWYLWGASPLISRYLVSDDLSAIDYVNHLPPMPKLFICGDQDHIVDYRQTVALYERASDPKKLWLIPNSGHTEAVTGEIEGGRQRVTDFFKACVARTSRAEAR